MSKSMDESRALGLFLTEHPRMRPAVVKDGWSALTPEQQAEAQALFQQWWGREMQQVVFGNDGGGATR